MLLFTKMRYFVFCLLLSAFITPSVPVWGSSRITVSGNLGKGCKTSPKKIWISSFYGTSLQPFDTTAVKKNGSFTFNLTIPDHAAYYRIAIGADNYTDIILKPGENPHFGFSSCDLKNIIKVDNSKENQLLFESRSIAKEKKGLEFFNAIHDLAVKEQQTYFGRTTLGYLPNNTSLPDTLTTARSKDEYLAAHYFDQVDFSHEDIVYSTLLPNIYMRYLEQHTEYSEEGFKASVDAILSRAQANELVYSFSLDFLISLFDKVGPEIILEYIVENYYFRYSCGASSTLTDETKKTIGSYTKLLPGNAVPVFSILPKNNSDSVSIQEICANNKLTLIVFWASFCHFCASKTNEWNNLYERYRNKGLEMVFISLDTEAKEWEEAVIQKRLKGIQSCDLKGWEGQVVKQLHVNRTPYLFLLENKGVILLKDVGGEQLESFISNYLH